MVMRWFTRAWAWGELSDDEFELRILDYDLHRSSLPPHAAAIDAVNLHDARGTRWAFDAAQRRVRLRMIAGDLQRGYEWVELRYEDAELFGATERDLAGWLRPGDAMVVDTEVELVAGPRIEHRFLVEPAGEFGVRFARADILRGPTTPAEWHGTLPPAAHDDIQLLYASGFWDYPRSGALLWQGRRYWFEETEWDSEVFDVLDLDAGQWAVEDQRQADFRRYVGTHMDVGHDGRRGEVRPAEEQHRYYDQWRGHPDPVGAAVAQWRLDEGPPGESGES